jgi:hypothetical protein
VSGRGAVTEIVEVGRALIFAPRVPLIDMRSKTSTAIPARFPDYGCIFRRARRIA